MTRLPTGIQSTGNTAYIVPPTVLKAEGLVKIYGKRRVVDGVSFYVNKGEVVGLLGPNGAGKTTSFRMTCGLIDANEGIVFLNGKDVTGWPLYRRAREGGMGYLPQLASVFQQLNVQDNLLGMMEMLGMDGRTRRAKCDSLLEKMKLTHLRKNLARGLSGGERRRLEIARALVSDPKIILLDEPFAAIDPITVQNLQAIIRQLTRDGISILITDHGVAETLEITDRSYIIEAGRVLCSGTPEEVLANEAAKNAYFGNLANSAGHPKPGALHARPATPPKPSRRFDDGEDLPHVPKRPSRPANPGPAKQNATRADDFDAVDGDRHDDGFEDYMPSRRRPSIKVRSPNADVSRSDKQGTADRQEASRLPEKPPSAGVRRRHDAEEPRNKSDQSGKSRTSATGGPHNGKDKPVPRTSLLGRLSGVFKKPTDDDNVKRG
ncbi:MAG: LPS export ABC transporter ATP-binding protein [Planctomycetaceae bacterium]|nr:LPS export ABC transporter ATP-binding protein [Planctomycetaceae bacterium]